MMARIVRSWADGSGATGATGATGAQGAAGQNAEAYTFPLTGNGTDAVFTVNHGLGTINLIGQVQDPADANAVVPGVDVTYPTIDTAQVVLSAPLANGVALRLILSGRDMTP